MSEISRSDAELVRRAKLGDLGAFEELVRCHQERFFSFIYRMVGNQSDAEEVVQEAWVRAWQNLKKFKEKSSFKTWLFRIGMNLAINLKTRGKKAEELNDLIPASPQDEPGEVYEMKRRELLVKEALAKLPTEQRTAIVLLIYEDMSYKEIAEVMGKSVRAVDSLLVRAKVKLREYLHNEG